MSVRAAHDGRVRHPGPREVVHVPSTTDEETRIFEPLDRSADDLHEARILPQAPVLFEAVLPDEAREH
jgi:hypothetical protein